MLTHSTLPNVQLSKELFMNFMNAVQAGKIPDYKLNAVTRSHRQVEFSLDYIGEDYTSRVLTDVGYECDFRYLYNEYYCWCVIPGTPSSPTPVESNNPPCDSLHRFLLESEGIAMEPETVGEVKRNIEALNKAIMKHHLESKK